MESQKEINKNDSHDTSERNRRQQQKVMLIVGYKLKQQQIIVHWDREILSSGVNGKWNGYEQLRNSTCPCYDNCQIVFRSHKYNYSHTGKKIFVMHKDTRMIGRGRNKII